MSFFRRNQLNFTPEDYDTASENVLIGRRETSQDWIVATIFVLILVGALLAAFAVNAAAAGDTQHPMARITDELPQAPRTGSEFVGHPDTWPARPVRQIPLWKAPQAQAGG